MARTKRCHLLQRCVHMVLGKLAVYSHSTRVPARHSLQLQEWATTGDIFWQGCTRELTATSTGTCAVRFLPDVCTIRLYARLIGKIKEPQACTSQRDWTSFRVTNRLSSRTVNQQCSTTTDRGEHPFLGSASFLSPAKQRFYRLSCGINHGGARVVEAKFRC